MSTTMIFILILTLSLIFILRHYAAGSGNLSRTQVTCVVMVWFLGIIMGLSP